MYDPYRGRSPGVGRPHAWLLVITASLCAAAAPLVAQAPQTGVEGVVLEAGSGEPLPAVLVRIAETRRQEMTHEDGAFHLLNLAPGRYTLVFDRLGYRSVRRVVQLQPGELQRLRVELEPTPLTIPGLVVTGTIGARAHEEVLRPTEVLSGLDLASRLDATLAGTLQAQAGVSSASMGPAPARPVIRGLGGDRILILEDGERMGDVSYTSADHAVALDALAADRIEVVRGPQALFYGSNALGGVVNVVREEIPASLPDRPRGRASLQGQTVNGGGAGELDLNGALGTVAARLEASYRGAGDLDTPAGPLENTQLRAAGGSVGASRVTGSGHAGAAYRFYGSRYGIPPDPVSGHAFGVDVEMRRHAWRGELRRLGGPGPFSAGALDASYTRYHHQEIEPEGLLGTEYGLHTASAQAVVEHDGRGVLARGALGARGEWRDYAFNTGRAVVRSHEYSAAGFFLEESAWRSLRLQVGGRYDVRRIDPLTEGDDLVGEVRPRTFGSWSGSFAALYDLRAGVFAGGSLARAFRTPSSDELFSRGPHLATYTFEIGNPDLREETAIGADAFLRVERGDIHVELAAFRNRIAGFVQTESTGQTREDLPVYRHANTEAVFHGWEAMAQWTPARWVVVDAAAAAVTATNVVTRQPLPFIPPLNGRVAVRVERAGAFTGLAWRAAARQDRVPSYCPIAPCPVDPAAGSPPAEFLPTDGHRIWDASAGYLWSTRGRLHMLTLRLDNLLDAEYRNHLSRVKLLMPEAGRGLTLLYRVSF
jgi:iron complex outermembrane recepter protein